MTDTPKAATADPGWYPDPTQPGRLQWWDGTSWTGHFSDSPAPDRSAPRPEISPQTPVYSPLIWLIVLLPVLSFVFLMSWNPVVALIVEPGISQTLDTTAMFTVPFLLLILSGWLIYGVSVLLAYLDWQWLRRNGVLRPFHWAWAFLGALVYVTGRSVIVHQVAPRRGLAPVWTLIAVTALNLITVSIKMATLFSMLATITTT